ncbi:NAD(P)/FAD-dependent oxidoreductase [Nocardia stercoris]|uniref:FAD-dependent monooxygenase n=1 Tax=Nocardia stercoris TaxID=2483361 RepID=A0A3M2L1F4_9NOCA|nr:FAD-dependent monooxygenase [Nocardia stercoris]RMI31401.1 FAD-dependent monooxygenase [Nocardia stercoris]
MRSESADVVVVGSRCAGAAAAIEFARHGRRVIALDSARFPSDTLSTHLLWPTGVAELETLGALPRVLKAGAPQLRTALAGGSGHTVRTDFAAVPGIGYAMCVRRIALDAALVDTARESGAQLREGALVTELVADAGRITGVRYRDRSGATAEVLAPLVVGADGRRSTVARLVGADIPYRSADSGRACYFAYWADAYPAWRTTAAQWRAGELLGTAFPCDDGLVLCLIQPPVARAERGQSAAARLYREFIAEIPELAARLRDCTQIGRVRTAADLTSYFRRSAGPGWALPGDAGHFKDPVTAQGIRDALRYGRLLAAAAAPVLDDPRALDRALRDWELERERDCLPVYQWTNRLARGEPMTALETELYRAAASDPELAARVLEVMTRVRPPGRMLAPGTAVALAARAAWRGRTTPITVADTLFREARDTVRDRHELWTARRRGLPPLPATVAVD